MNGGQTDIEFLIETATIDVEVLELASTTHNCGTAAAITFRYRFALRVSADSTMLDRLSSCQSGQPIYLFVFLRLGRSAFVYIVVTASRLSRPGSFGLSLRIRPWGSQ